MNTQIPFGPYNPNVMQPLYPDNAFPNNNIDTRLTTIEQKVNALEKKIRNLESQLNTNPNNNFNPYQSSMHMM